MTVLLDTHVLIWAGLDDPRLSPFAASVVTDPHNELLLSPASYWELAIKISRGKIDVRGGFDDFMAEQTALLGLRVLPVTTAHASRMIDLPFYHADPFDRMLVAQAVAEDVPLLFVNNTLDSYPVPRVWDAPPEPPS